jgi:ATP-binding cassette subfamily C protein LapB
MQEKSNTAWLREVTKPLRSIYREVFLLSLFINFLALAVPVFSLQVYDRVIFSSGLTTLQGLVIGMIVVVAFDYILRQTRGRLMQRAALRIDVGVADKVFKKILALPMCTLEGRPSAYWNSLFRDVEVVRNALSGPSAVLLIDLPFAILFIALVAAIAAPVLPVLMIALPLFLLLAWRSAAVLNAANKEERRAGFGRDELISELIAGRATVKALSLDRALRPLWEDRHAATIEQAIKRGRQTETYGNLTTTLSAATIVSITTVGALAIINQDLTVGALIASNMLAGRIIGPFNQLVRSWRSFVSFRQATGRLTQLFETVEERGETGIKLDRPKGEITVESVSFRYSEDGPEVIQGARLQLKAGSLVTVMGPNGGGKTTLSKLIPGLYKPTQGRVLLDGADISQFARQDLAAWISYVPQETFLFGGTVRDNIAMAHTEASDAEVIRAAKLAGLHDYLIDLPDGYATDIGEAGHLLPGGMRQRVAIARALVSDPPVLIFDEPTSNLDRVGEQALCETFVKLAADHTILVVTHSQTVIAASDQLLVMQKGKIVRAGRPEDVLPEIEVRRRPKRPDGPGETPQAMTRRRA